MGRTLRTIGATLAAGALVVGGLLIGPAVLAQTDGTTVAVRSG